MGEIDGWFYDVVDVVVVNDVDVVVVVVNVVVVVVGQVAFALG